MKQKNTIFILMDELYCYKYLPKEILDQLKGYNAFKKIGVEFTNIHCNRTVCSPARSSIISGVINHGIQDNIDNNFQYDYIPKLDPSLPTIAKLCKKNNYDITAYYGKQHFDSALASTVFTAPMINTNTRKYMNQYGFDIYSTYGDTFYTPNQAIFGDLVTYEMLTSDNNPEFDWIDPKTGNKYVGLLPFLKARVADSKQFYCEFQLENPHDTQHMIQNFSQLPSGTQLQFWAPFIKEQFAEYQKEGTLAINPFIPIEYTTLKTNFFEKTYSEYKNNINSLPFKESYELDYVSNSETNSIFPYFVCNQQVFKNTFTFPDDQTDIKSWKNLINNYYGLILESDSYLYKIYKFMEENDMFKNTNVIITADHGDQMSAHGLKQKNFHFEQSTNVPLIIYSPDLCSSVVDKKFDNLGNSIDIFPTIQTILNINYCDKRIVGNSLLQRSFGKLSVKNISNDVLHITNGFMFLTSGFTFNSWFNSQPKEIQDKVIYKPKNIFNYINQFIFTITKFNGRTYKFVRFYNINEIIIYNFKNNPRWRIAEQAVLLNASMIKQYLSENIILNNEPLVEKFVELLERAFPMGFTFEDAYELISDNDDIILFLFYLFVFKFINDNYSFEIIIPGFLNNFISIADNPNYAFFCYDLTNDPNEIVNLADPNYPQRFDIKLFEYLNCKLNQNIHKYNCSEFINIFQYKSIDTLLQLLIKINKKIIDLNINQLLLLTTVAFNNNFDTTYNLQLIIASLLKE